MPTLDLIERELVVDTFATLVEGLYAHLPLKRARYATDPLQRLRILRQRLGQLDDLAFHYELAAVITELRDAHTRYIGPASLEGKAAMLPFLVESFGETSRQRYVVSKVADDPELVPDPTFEPGVELRWWNAVPIDVAVDRQADQETGGRPDSRRARALESLTLRALQFAPPPAEHWVIVGYVDRDGVEREARFDWRVVSPRRARTAGRPQGAGGLAYAIDSAAEVARRVKKLLFAPTAWFEDTRPQPQATRRRAAALRTHGAAADPDDWLATDFQDTVAARAVRTPSGRFGYLRLWSFDVTDDVAYVEEVARLLRLLPQRGLIIDLRANPGGLIWAAERVLQLLTPKEVVPTRFSLVATPLTRAMALAQQNSGELEPWRESLVAAVATGELYSQAVPITPPRRCNDMGQVYGGPVVAVVDANTYSAGDLFAAGFYDNEIGTLITVGEATGAGGANVWSPEDVSDALLGTVFEQKVLPAGIGYTISVRRATRVGRLRRRGHRGRRRAGPPQLRHDPARPHGQQRRSARDVRAAAGRATVDRPGADAAGDDGAGRGQGPRPARRVRRRPTGRLARPPERGEGRPGA